MTKPFSFWRKTAAAVAGSAMLLGSSPALAQMTHYTDVQAGAWYEDAASALLETGALDASETRLRPNDLATRAEVLKLLVLAYGEDLVYPATPSFSDVPRTAWYYPYVETAAQAGWIKGDDNCYNQGFARCTARPAGNVNRAEMAIFMQRAFNLPSLSLAPVFSDTMRSEWYFTPIQVAADHCILQGDEGTDRVRPAAFMNRAEMIVMFYRASTDMRYGRDCGEPAEAIPNINSASARSARTVRLVFNVNLNANRIDDEDRYTIERSSGGGEIDVDDVIVIDSRTVDLILASNLTADISYRASVSGMLTQGEVSFSDAQTFTFNDDVVQQHPGIDTVTVRDTNTIRVRFTEDVHTSRADDTGAYLVERVSNGSDIDVTRVTVVDNRTVDIDLGSTLSSQTSYRVSVDAMVTRDDDEEFDDTRTFSFSDVEARISGITVRDSDTLRVAFSEDVDENRVEEESRFTLERTSGGGDINIDLVTMIDDRTVDVDLASNLADQTNYVLRVANLLTENGDTFSDSFSFASTQTGITIQSASVVSSTRLRLVFSDNLNESVAENAIRYRLAGAGGDINIGTAGLVDGNIVDLTLNSPLTPQQQYTVFVTNLQTDTGVTFSDDIVFLYASANVSFSATTLTGGKEIPPVTTSATGTGTLTLTNTGLQYDITVSGLSAGEITGAHFHTGDTNEEGPVAEAITFTNFRATGTWTDLTSQERLDLLSGDIYVNVHTGDFPDGEIRGQVEPQ